MNKTLFVLVLLSARIKGNLLFCFGEKALDTFVERAQYRPVLLDHPRMSRALP